MKDRFYILHSPLEGDSNLEKLFNNALKSIETERLFTAPANTSSDWYEKDDEHKAVLATGFYELCMIEVYFHSVISHLKRWKKEAIRYNTEFKGSWKFYAYADRNDLIKDYGAEEEDYDENGNILKHIPNDRLQSYSIVESFRGYNDVVFSVEPSKMHYLYRALERVSEFSVTKLFAQCFDKEIPTYREDEDGNMVKNTWAEQTLNEVKDQHVADNIRNVVYLILLDFKDLVDEIVKLKADRDNKQFFKALPNRIDNLLNLELCPSK